MHISIRDLGPAALIGALTAVGMHFWSKWLVEDARRIRRTNQLGDAGELSPRIR